MVRSPKLGVTCETLSARLRMLDQGLFHTFLSCQFERMCPFGLTTPKRGLIRRALELTFS